MLQAARAGAFDFVIAESLSRIARDEEDSPAIRKRLDFAGVKIILRMRMPKSIWVRFSARLSRSGPCRTGVA
jgi:Resolvase, N terminal domain